jgi:hypothetical protein
MWRQTFSKVALYFHLLIRAYQDHVTCALSPGPGPAPLVVSKLNVSPATPPGAHRCQPGRDLWGTD